MLVVSLLMVILLLVLWTVDTVQTVEMTSRFGYRVEANPVARFFIKRGEGDFVAFKMVDLVFLSGIFYYLWNLSSGRALVLLGLFNTVYLVTVLHNQKMLERERV